MAAHAADRNLLFGLLALQNGLIDQGQLVAAFQAWTRDRARPLADHLAARGDLEPDQCAGVEAMVGLHLKKHGDAERSLAAIPAGRSTRESLAAIGDSDIEQTLTQLAPDPDGDADRTASYSVGTATGDGQRFRVLRPHARGGLGAVFVALDAELHREVALKRILDDRADDPVSRARFLLEAEITGGLEHPGIVPVYGLGTYDDGLPFYAMRFIKGDSLKEAVDQFHANEALRSDPGRRSLELRKLLRRFTDVCNAIEYAHSRGVLHRDIKPGNIIVGKYGETLMVDWGLAKAAGRADPTSGERTLMPSPASGSAETLPGSVLGTPAFMSPEQAEGDLERLGPRSDVYSLGATLYYLLTGHPPAEGELHDVIRAVQRGEFRPPRQVDATIDPALEAVCLKAMAARPEDRYASCRALAEDVERWMADEPVTAYREPTSARLGRWVRRHKPTVAAAVALLFTAVVALSVSTVLIGFEQSRTRDAYRAEAQQRRRAEGRSRLARRAVDDMYTQVAERWLVEQPQMQQIQREFLEKARDLYGELADEPSSEPALRREVAAAHRRVGDIEARLGRYDQAEQSQGLALAIADELSARSPADPAYRFDVALAAVRLGRLEDRTGRYPEAERALRRGVGILSELVQADPGRHEYRRSLAEGRYHLAFLLRRTGRWPDAEPEFRRAAELAEALEREGDESLETRRWHANILTDFAGSLSRVGRLDEAVRSYRQAIGLFDRLIAAAPAMPLYRGDLTSALASLGFAESQQGALADAEGHYRRAIDLGRRLVGDFPDVPHYRDRLEYAYNNLALLLQRKARPAEAEEFFRQAIDLAEALLRESPDPPGARADLVRDLVNYGNFLQYVARSQEAEATLRRAIAISERLVADFPEVPEHRVDFLAWSECSLADLLRDNGRLPEAEAAYRHVLEVLDVVPTLSTDTQSGRQLRALALGNLGQVRMVRRELTEAERLLERAVEFGRANLRLAHHNLEALTAVASFEADLAQTRLARGDRAGAAEAAAEAAQVAGELLRITGEQPDSFEDGARLSLTSIYGTLGLVFSLAGRHRESQEANGNLVAVLKRLLARHADQPDYRSRLGGALNNLGMALAAQGDYGSAILRYQEAIGHQRAVFDQQPQVEQFRRFLSNHYKGLAEALRALGRSDEAVEAARQRVKLWPGSPVDLYDIACDLALCMPIAKDAAMRGRYADEAMAILRAAVAAGWSDAARTARDSDLNPLRHRPDFRTLLVELFDRAFPADPFARDR